MKVLIATKYGFCFGVEHAIEKARKLLDDKETVYCLGPLIHNSHVVNRLSSDGLRVVDNLSQIDTCEQSRSNTPTEHIFHRPDSFTRMSAGTSRRDKKTGIQTGGRYLYPGQTSTKTCGRTLSTGLPGCYSR
jgi:4-hydroxy-3-methylbut-2-enyl diphosphate reductase LytB-like protein